MTGRGSEDASQGTLDAAGTVSADSGPGRSFDAGPPAKVTGEPDAGEPDADDGAILPPAGDAGGCSTLADCPYQTATNVAGVACTSGACVITCKGETYDVNGDASDGCEVAAACPIGNGTTDCPVDNHTKSAAVNLGSFPCTDGDSMQDLTGTIPSDDRDHAPAIDGFDAVTGSAPSFFQMLGTGVAGPGGIICENNANFAIQMNAPTSQMACYVLTLVTDVMGTQTCTTDASGSCAITNSAGSYGSNTTLYVSVSKAESCTAAGFSEDGAYAITGHL